MASRRARASSRTPAKAVDLVKTREDLVSVSAHYSNAELQLVIKDMNDLALDTADKVNLTLPEKVRIIYLIFIDAPLVVDSNGKEFCLGKVGKVDVQFSTRVLSVEQKEVKMIYAEAIATVRVDRTENAEVTIDKLMWEMLKKRNFRIVQEKMICEKLYSGIVFCEWNVERFERGTEAERRWRARIGSVQVKRGFKGERSCEIVSQVLLKPKGGPWTRANSSDKSNLGISEWILAQRDTLMQGFEVDSLKKVHPKFPVKFVTLPADPAEEDKNILKEEDFKDLRWTY